MEEVEVWKDMSEINKKVNTKPATFKLPKYQRTFLKKSGELRGSDMTGVLKEMINKEIEKEYGSIRDFIKLLNLNENEGSNMKAVI